jgi:multidrug efflux pump
LNSSYRITWKQRHDVRDKVSQAQRLLPRDCDPPIVSKADADARPNMNIAIHSPKRSLLELSEIAELTFKEQLQTISGVSVVNIWGQKRYAMRIWLDPAKLAGYQMTPLDVRNALQRENVELPAGSIEGDKTELTIRVLGLMSSAEEFNNLILKRSGDQLIRVKDIGSCRTFSRVPAQHHENERNSDGGYGYVPHQPELTR